MLQSLMENTAKKIAQYIALSQGLSVNRSGLRFDKVVIRLLHTLRSAVEHCLPTDKALIVTITAPIKCPAATAAELATKILTLLVSPMPQQDYVLAIGSNAIRIRMVATTTAPVTRLIGLVHNPDINAGRLLDAAAQWLRSNPAHDV